MSHATNQTSNYKMKLNAATQHTHTKEAPATSYKKQEREKQPVECHSNYDIVVKDICSKLRALKVRSPMHDAIATMGCRFDHIKAARYMVSKNPELFQCYDLLYKCFGRKNSKPRVMTWNSLMLSFSMFSWNRNDYVLLLGAIDECTLHLVAVERHDSILVKFAVKNGIVPITVDMARNCHDQRGWCAGKPLFKLRKLPAQNGKLSQLIREWGKGEWVDYISEAVVGMQRSMVARLAEDLNLDVKVLQDKLRGPIEELAAKVGGQVLTSRDTRIHHMPADTDEAIIKALNGWFGQYQFVRSHAGHHPHPFHHGSRMAVSRYLTKMYSKSSLLYDIGGDYQYHLAEGNFHVHSLVDLENPTDRARFTTQTIKAKKWAQKQLSNGSTGTSPREMAARSLLCAKNPFVCTTSMSGCKHVAKGKSTFAISIDTLTHLKPNELVTFYNTHLVAKATHAITLPQNYSLEKEGLLEFNEGIWERDSTHWEIKFHGESVGYRQRVDITEFYLTVPLIDSGSTMIYCRTNGYKGAHLIIEHFQLSRVDVEAACVRHVIWFNHNVDTLRVEMPVVDATHSKTLIKREHFSTKTVMVNVWFYEKLLNRLMQSYDWASLKSYAAAMVGKSYATSAGVFKLLSLTNEQVRDHCLIAFWSVNHIEESIQPLLRKAESKFEHPDFLTSLWEAVKLWAKNFASKFDPSDAMFIQEFIASNRDDGVHLINTLGQASRCIAGLNAAIQMRASQRTSDYLAVSLNTNCSNAAPDIENWLADGVTDTSLMLHELMSLHASLDTRVKSCNVWATCKCDHSDLHVHTVNLGGKYKIGECECCRILSSIDSHGLCSVCNPNSRCKGKSTSCSHAHGVINDECCGSLSCKCSKGEFCGCCGLPSVNRLCNVCWDGQIGPVISTAMQGDDNAHLAEPDRQCMTMNDKRKHVKRNPVKPQTQMDECVGKEKAGKIPKRHLKNDVKTPTDNIELGGQLTVDKPAKQFVDEDPALPIPSSADLIPSQENAVMSIEDYDAPSSAHALGTDDSGRIRTPAPETQGLVSDVVTKYSECANNDDMVEEPTASESQQEEQDCLIEVVADLSPEDLQKKVRNIAYQTDYSGIRKLLVDLPSDIPIGESIIGGLIGKPFDVVGDGRCGAHSISMVTGHDIEAVSHWLVEATGHDDWHNDEELAAYFISAGINVIMICDGVGTLYRSTLDKEAYAINHMGWLTHSQHWAPVPMTVKPDYDSLTIQGIDNFRRILNWAENWHPGSVEGAYCFRHRALATDEMIKAMGRSVAITDIGIERKIVGSQTRPMLSTSGGVEFLTGPTGSGKSVTAHLMLNSPTVVITPSRATVIGCSTYVSGAIGRANSLWYPASRAKVANEEIENSTVMYTTVDAVYNHVVLGHDPLWKKMLENRPVVADEIHQLTPKYAMVLRKLQGWGSRLIYASATLPGVGSDLRTRQDTTTHIIDDAILSQMLEDVLQSNEVPDGTCLVVPSLKTVTYKDKSLVQLTSETVGDESRHIAKRIIATECVTTGATLRNINVMIDSGMRYRIEYVPQPSEMRSGRLVVASAEKVRYSLAELVQSRGRVGRVSSGDWYGVLPSSQTYVTRDDKIMYALTCGMPIEAQLIHRIHAWENVDTGRVTQALTLWERKLQDKYSYECEEYCNQLKDWLAHAKKMKKLVSSKLKLRTTRAVLGLEDYITEITNTHSVGGPISAIVPQISVKFDLAHVVPALSYRKNLLREVDSAFNKGVLLDIDQSDVVDALNDTSSLIIDKLMKAMINDMLTDVFKLIKSSKCVMLTGGPNKSISGTVAASSVKLLANKMVTKLKSGDIVAITSMDHGNIMLVNYGELAGIPFHHIITVTHSTRHYNSMLRAATAAASSESDHRLTLSNSIWITGPPGSGKTKRMADLVGNGYIISKQSLMLQKDGWITPDQLTDRQPVLGVDEIGLFSPMELCMLACFTDKLVITGDIKQLQRDPNSMEVVMSGSLDTSQILEKLTTNKVKLEGSYRLGHKTCAVANRLGLPILSKRKDTIDEGVFKSQVGNLNSKLFKELVEDLSPDLVICGTNNIATLVKKMFPQHTVTTISRAQGAESKRTLVVLIGDTDHTYATDQLYVAMSRHTEKCVFATDSFTDHQLPFVEADGPSKINYAKALGGETKFFNVGFLTPDSVTYSRNLIKRLNNMIQCATGEDCCHHGFPDDQMNDDLRCRLASIFNLDSHCLGNGSDYLVLVVNGDHIGIRAMVDGNAYIIRSEKFTYPMPTHVEDAFKSQIPLSTVIVRTTMITLSALKKLGFKLTRAVTMFFKKLVAFAIVLWSPGGDSMSSAIGGSGTVWELVTSFIYAIANRSREFFEKAVAIFNSTKKWMDGNTAGEDLLGWLKRSLADNGDNTPVNDFFGGQETVIDHIKNIYQMLKSILMDGLDHLRSWFDKFVNSMNKWCNAYYIPRMSDEEIVEKIPEFELPDVQDTLFDYHEEEKMAHQTLQSTTVREKDSDNPVLLGVPPDFTVVGDDFKVKIDLATWAPGMLTRMMCSREDDCLILSAKVVPGVKSICIHGMRSGDCLLKVVTVDDICYKIYLKKIEGGYTMIWQDNIPDDVAGHMETASRWISRLGGANSSDANNDNDTPMVILSSIVKQVARWLRKTKLVACAAALHLVGQVDKTQLRCWANMMHVYRKLSCILYKRYNGKKSIYFDAIGGPSWSTISMSHTDGKILVFSIRAVNEQSTELTIYYKNINHLPWLITQISRMSFESSVSVTQYGGNITNVLGKWGKKRELYDNSIEPHQLTKLLSDNPLTYVTDLVNATGIPQIGLDTGVVDEVDKLLNLDVNELESIHRNDIITFAIPSGHGKTTLCGKLRRIIGANRVLDVDEIVEQAHILLVSGFSNKMNVYRTAFDQYMRSRSPTAGYLVVFCHSTSVTCGWSNLSYRLFNNYDGVPVDRIWSNDNVEALRRELRGPAIDVNNHGELFNVTAKLLNKRMCLNIPVTDDHALLTEQISALGALDFTYDQLGPDSTMVMPLGQHDTLQFRDHMLGLGEQRYFATGPLPNLARPTIQRLSVATLNAITSRLMGRKKLRTKVKTNDELLMSLDKFFVQGWEKLLAQYEKDKITLTNEMVADWLRNKGSSVELVNDTVTKCLSFDAATATDLATAHFKVENLMKEQVDHIVDQVGRIIVWNNQNINMFVCPIINECKRRLKTLLNDRCIYADGLSISDLNYKLRDISDLGHFVEMDLSKQDRQTDKPLLEFEWWLVGKLGCPELLLRHMTVFLRGFKIRTPDQMMAKLPPMRFTGGAMTSLGNEIRNLLLLSDVLEGQDWGVVLTLGDDSLVTMSQKPDENRVRTIAAAFHNVECTFESRTSHGIFLQLIVGPCQDGGLVACHNIGRLKEKLCFSPYPNTSSDWKAKWSSFLMMIGECAQTRTAMPRMGLAVFPMLGSNFSDRLILNSIHLGIDVTAVLSMIGDICTYDLLKSYEIKTTLPIILSKKQLLGSMVNVSAYKDNHEAMFHKYINIMSNL